MRASRDVNQGRQVRTIGADENRKVIDGVFLAIDTPVDGGT